MSERIITLFGEEIVPEQLKAVGRSRSKKKTEDKQEPANEEKATKEEPTSAEQEPTVTETEATTPLPEEPNEETPAHENQNEIITATAIDVQEITAETEVILPHEEVVETPKKEKIIPANLPDDWQGSKQYYSIGEVADLFKVKTSHIRFWTNEFKLKVRTTRKGDRLYTPAQIRELKTINHLVKERGFTLKGAKTRLKEPEKMEIETVDLKQSLLHLRNKLLAIKNQLK